MDDNEAFYDEEIAPALAELARRCSDRGMSMIAGVEYAPGDYGGTYSLIEGACRPLHTARAALKSRDNADTLIGWVMEDARERGHNSVYLKMLGVPLKPGETP